VETYDLIVIGSGTGNMMFLPEFDSWKVAIVERGVFGGTCLNRGCIPSKMFVLAADRVLGARHSSKLGVDLSVDAVRWTDIVERVFGRIDPIAEDGEEYRRDLPNVTVINAEAEFTGHKTLTVDGHEITAPNIVIAAGARPVVPAVPGMAEVGYHTSDTIMRLPDLPPRLAVLGGGYIANEMAHVFEALGSEVTIVQRSDLLLRAEDHDIAHAFTALAGERFALRLDTTVTNCTRTHTGIALSLAHGDTIDFIEVDEILVAIGRMPNGSQLGVRASGVDLDGAGYVVTDGYGETTVEGVWAVGDVSNPAQLKHTANEEGRVVAHNIAHPEDRREIDLDPIPHAVFTSPQIASVGYTEQKLDALGRACVIGRQDYGGTAYGWALEDATGFCKVIADPDTRLLLGAHIMGPQAATLIQQLIQGMRFGLTVDEMAAGQLYIHPALTEVVEQALLALPA
jgi:mycothione reductase